MGHGHVKPNVDGSTARCGGPSLCAECAFELASITQTKEIKMETATKEIAKEFRTYQLSQTAIDQSNYIRAKFDEILSAVENVVPPGNERYVALVKTKLEEACMFSIKAISQVNL